MTARPLLLAPGEILLDGRDPPPPYPRDHTEIFEQITGRVVAVWNPHWQTIQELDALLDRVFLQTKHGPDMECLPTAPIPIEFEGMIYAMDHRGMCLVVDDFQPIIHIDELRRQYGLRLAEG